MYPYSSRWRWLANSQWGHLLKALERRSEGRRDTVLDARADSLRFWARIRSVVMVLLSAGVIGTIVASLESIFPGGAVASEATKRLAASVGSATGLLSLVYLFLTRLLGQIETDIWALLVIEE